MGKRLSLEEILPILQEGASEELHRLFSNDDVFVDEEVLKSILGRAEECDPDALENFLRHMVFSGQNIDYGNFYSMLTSSANRIRDKRIKRIVRETGIYAYARLVAEEGNKEAYLRLKDMLRKYVESVSSPEDRAFTIYEVITLLSGGDVRYLKDILFSFDRYIPYIESFAPLVFGDLGMIFYDLWESVGDSEYRELAVVLLQKAIFSVSELFRSGKVEDFPLNLGNFFAYMSTLIPLLEEEAQETDSDDVREEKVRDIREISCLALRLFIEFADKTTLDKLKEFFPSEEDARLVSESVPDNFMYVMEALFETGLFPEVEAVWSEMVPEQSNVNYILQGALKVREVLCDRR